jgi:protein SCO1
MATNMSRLSPSDFRRLLLAASISLMLISLGGLLWLNLRLTGKSFFGTTPLPVLAQLPDFSLLERSGQKLGLADLRGKVWIADFIFTRCPGPCPRMSSRMAVLQSNLRDEGLRLVSISVDPEFDTQEVLAKYAARYQAEEERWFFVTGDKTAIHHLAKSGFLVGGVDDVTLHTTRFVLVDRQGRVRGYYSSSEEDELRKLQNDARALLRETGP